MSWRIVVVSSVSKLDLKLGYLVIRNDITTRIHLSEISTLIVESTAVSLTAALLCELTKRKIKVIFCDEKRNPQSELSPYYGSHDSSAKLKAQTEWTKEVKALVWTEIVRSKITQQSLLLKRYEKEEWKLLAKYITELEPNDTTNREGHAAKVYFNALFGNEFSRSDTSEINGALNYGYAVLLSAFNREIVASGYLTQFGIFHDNIFNQFNLSCDLMEPFRPLIDKTAYTLRPEKFDKEEKIAMVNILNENIIMDNKRCYVNNAIRVYCKSIFDALNEKDISQIKFYRYEL